MREIGRASWRLAAATTLMVAVGLTLTTPAHALFIGPYDVANWTAIVNYDATVDLSGAPNTIVLTGAADRGTLLGGAPDDLDFTIAAVADSTLQFDWTYTSLDSANWDWGSFLLNGVETVLANNAAEPAGGTFNIALLSGQTFGFRVHSVDRAYSPGILTVTNFSVVAVVPEPTSGALVLTGMLWMAVIVRKRRAGLPAS